MTSRLNQFSLKDKSDEPVNSQLSGGLWSWKMEIISEHADDEDIGFRYDSAVQVTLTALYLQIKLNEFEIYLQVFYFQFKHVGT